MSNLDKKYSIHLDLINNIKNENMKFSLSDNETSDFYIKITKSMISIDLADKVVSLYVVKPNKNVVHTTVTLYTKCKKANVFYCDLPNNFKNIKGSYYAQIAVEDTITGEKVVTPSKFSYTVESDIISEASGVVDTEENKNILDLILSDLTDLKANKIEIDDTTASATTVYSGNKIEKIKEELSSQISAIGGSGGSGYTHPATHPASMITGLSTIATSGNYEDLTNKPTIPNKTSQLTNDSNFVNSTYVNNKIAEASLSGGEVDLSGYQTRTDNTLNTKDKTIVGGINEIKASVDSIEIPTKTSDLINDSGYLTEHQSLDGYAKTEDIPTTISQLTNDAGFITLNEVPVTDLSGYVTKDTGNASQITFSDGQTFQAKLDAGMLKGDQGEKGQDGLTTDISLNGTTYTHNEGIITLPDYPTVPTNISEFTNDAKYASEAYVSSKIAEAQLGGNGEIDLSGYATKDDIPTKTSQLTNDSNFITRDDIPTNYVTTDAGNASQITFTDGQTFQEKLESGLLKGEQGEKGDKGDTGEQGIPGEKGEKGNAFTYEDFTPEQLLALKGDKGDKGDTFTYEDFTPEQLTSLKGEQGVQGLKGDKGDTGEQGIQGEKGDTGQDGATFTPSVDAEGNLSWTNDKGLVNPTTVNIKGDKGEKGDKGDTGAQGSAGLDGRDGLTTSIRVNGTTYTHVDGVITLPDYPTSTGESVDAYTKAEMDNIIQEYTGGKKQVYLTQSEYDVLTDGQKNDSTIVYNITDAERITDNVATDEEVSEALNSIFGGVN